MSRTKIIAVLGLIVAVGKVGIDALDGGAFNLNSHFAELAMVFGALGLFFLRDAVQKIIEVVNPK